MFSVGELSMGEGGCGDTDLGSVGVVEEDEEEDGDEDEAAGDGVHGGGVVVHVEDGDCWEDKGMLVGVAVLSREGAGDASVLHPP